MRTRERINASELDIKDTVVSINRVTKVVKGGKNLSFSALVVVGDGHGVVGFGVGKAKEVPSAIKKGIEAAKKNLIRVPIQGSTIPHPIVGNFGHGGGPGCAEGPGRDCQLAREGSGGDDRQVDLGLAGLSTMANQRTDSKGTGTVTVTLRKSAIGFSQRQKDVVKSLGLRRIRHTVELKDTPAIRGLIHKVRHLVSVREA